MLDRPREQRLHRRQVLALSTQFVATRGGATTKFPIALALWPSRSQGIGFERGGENWHTLVVVSMLTQRFAREKGMSPREGVL
jgi:hypothetical protein